MTSPEIETDLSKELELFINQQNLLDQILSILPQPLWEEIRDHFIVMFETKLDGQIKIHQDLLPTALNAELLVDYLDTRGIKYSLTRENKMIGPQGREFLTPKVLIKFSGLKVIRRELLNTTEIIFAWGKLVHSELLSKVWMVEYPGGGEALINVDPQELPDKLNDVNIIFRFGQAELEIKFIKDQPGRLVSRGNFTLFTGDPTFSFRYNMFEGAEDFVKTREQALELIRKSFFFNLA